MIIDYIQPDAKFFFSFQCPYSYLSWELLRKKMENCSGKIAPIGLSVMGSPLTSYLEFWSEMRWQKLATYGKELGIIIKKPAVYYDSSLANSFVNLNNSKHIEPYISCLFKAVFADNINISNSQTLFDYLNKNGVSCDLNHDNNPAPIDSVVKELRMLPTIKVSNDDLIGLVTESVFSRMLKHHLD
ncbi:MAG: DsbA family protein [Candidatus Riflebacteria bacterium]|jgi:2-hydroxychromene-2-carboxylate isomerase|nr:DsbA family protein [Candidatus Riflebacteria bacterium]